MEEKKRYKVYKIIMLIVLVAFITFMITSIGLYQYFVKGDNFNVVKCIMEEKKRYKVYKIIMLIVLVAFITFMITSIGLYQYFVKGDNLNKHLLLSASPESKDIANSLDTYKAILDKYYLGEINEEDLKEGAIRGYIEGVGDKYTEYISKEEMQEYMEDTKGNFVGIGIYMIQDKKSDKIMVVAPIKNSPAEKAGVQAGDLILAVDEQECTANDMNTISSKIKGEAGTTVKLKLQRGNETLELDIKRESVTVNPVESKMLESNIGYIKFTSFDENTSEDFKKNFETLQKQGAKSLIIDLRPIKNSPAEKAGVQAGDLILAVDGQECTANDMNTISSKIKGEAGTIVKLKLQRGNDTLELEIKRESVTVNPVESKMLESNIGYIKFTSFDENTSEDFKKNFETLQKKGAKSLIIDLRNNGGGIVGEALKIADYITEKDSVLLYEVNK